MKLYTGPLCINGHACRIVLHEKDIDCELFYVTPDRVHEELAELNPYGETPTLVDRDLVLYDSVVINEYFDERFPHPPLLPIDPIGRAKARLMISRLQRDWLEPVQQCVRGRAKLDKKTSKFLWDGLLAMSAHFADHKYVLGDEFSLADCYLAPLLWRLPMLRIELPRQALKLIEYGDRMFAKSTFGTSLNEVEREIRAA